MKMIYETPQIKHELLTNDDVISASGFSPDTSLSDNNNTYVNNYSMFGYTISG